jgi:protein-S-isoprenylcysteine O-methyltransferase
MGQFHWYWVFDFSYFAWIGMELWVLIRDRRAVSGESADRGSIWFIIAVFAAGLTAAFYMSFLSRGTRIAEFRFAIFLLGIVLMWSGMAFRLWAIAVLGRFFRTTVMVQDGHQLITTGPYRFLRHPSYTGGTLTFIGIGLALGNWLSAAILLATPLIGFGYRISVEERALGERFGTAYAEFSHHRWRLVPLVY